MKNLINLLLLFLLLGCHKEKTPFPIQIEYALLNSKGEKTNSFKQGEEIIFQLSMTNVSQETWYLPFDSQYGILGNKDLFYVFKNKEGIGSPQKDVSFLFKKALKFEPNSNKKFSIPWIVTDSTKIYFPFFYDKQNPNKILLSGTYESKFNLSYSVTDREFLPYTPSESGNINYNLTFNIK
jgi:hypothetical protein